MGNPQLRCLILISLFIYLFKEVIKIYKKIFIEQEETHYRIYSDGRFMSEKTGRYYKGTVRNGYKWFDMRWKNKKYSKSQHRLIAINFIENPMNYEYVHHINNNRLDNRIENLKWVSASENNLKVNKSLSLKDHNDYLNYDLSKEEWKVFKDTIYMVSNLGRVKNTKTNKILKGKILNSGYREYCLTFNDKKQSFTGHKLTWEVWNGEKQKVINHINGEKLDNRIINLENVTHRENTIKAIYETKTLKYKKTACFDKEAKLIRIRPQRSPIRRSPERSS